jgi:FkbH-like protein
MTEYRTGKYVHCFSLDDHAMLVAEPLFSESSVLDGDSTAIFTAIRRGIGSIAKLVETLGIRQDRIEQAVRFLEKRHFIVEADEDEDVRVDKRLKSILGRMKGYRGPHNRGQDFAASRRKHRDYTALELDNLEARIPFDRMIDVKFLIVGGCVTQFAADALQQGAEAYGLRATVEVIWPQTLELGTSGADVLIYQPSTTWFLGPLWDDGPFLTDRERASRLELLKEQLRLSLTTARAHVSGGLLIVQGFSTPTYSPLGFTEFRNAQNYHRIVYELNEVITNVIRNDPNAMFVDEERLLSGVGKLRLIDDSVSTFSHRAPIDVVAGASPVAPSRAETFDMVRSCHAPRLFAEAYLDCYVAWTGIGRIKCIIVDLDNTLWPGVVGEAGFEIVGSDAYQTFKYGAFGGIHQALKILKDRGVLLAACSRNNEMDSLRAWLELDLFATERGLSHVLRPNDFVIRRINWERKSLNVRDISSALGCAPAAILFIDDNAVEREEVQAAFPEVRTLGENLHLVRSKLLSDPCLQNNMQTVEGKSRTELVRSQLARDAFSKEVSDERQFLAKLDIQMTVAHVRCATSVARITELVQRTNQFNTTFIRLNAAEIQAFLDSPHCSAFVLEASDRFASYGTVGACLIRDAEIIAFVLSCRVAPLHLEIPFLSVALKSHSRIPVTGTIVVGPRNQPCRQLYSQAGFAETAPGRFVLNSLNDLPPVDSNIYNVAFAVI